MLLLPQCLTLLKMILPSSYFLSFMLLSVFLIAWKVTIFEYVMDRVLIGSFDITAVSQYLWA